MMAIPKCGLGPLDSVCSSCTEIFFFFFYLPRVFCILIEKRTLRGPRTMPSKLLWGIQSAMRVMIIATCHWACTHFTEALGGSLLCLPLTDEQTDSKTCAWLSSLPRVPHPTWTRPQCYSFLSVPLVLKRGKSGFMVSKLLLNWASRDQVLQLQANRKTPKKKNLVTRTNLAQH